jgi:hypothetical protein
VSEEEVRNPTVWLREIAVQLAEQNALARESLDLRKADDENLKSFREQSLRTAAEMKGIMQSPPAPPQIVAERGPLGPFPTHLGCLLLMPDGSHCIAIDGGEFVPLEPAEAARILALLSKPPEGKPS